MNSEMAYYSKNMGSEMLRQGGKEMSLPRPGVTDPFRTAWFAKSDGTF